MPREHNWTWLVYGSSALSLAAAMIHTLVVREHFEEWWGYGIFFVVVTAAQIVYSVALLRSPRRPVLLVGIAGNLAVIALYVATRTVGIPLGPSAGEIEKVGAIDLASKAAELLLVAALGYLVWTTPPRRAAVASLSTK